MNEISGLGSGPDRIGSEGIRPTEVGLAKEKGALGAPLSCIQFPGARHYGTPDIIMNAPESDILTKDNRRRDMIRPKRGT